MSKVEKPLAGSVMLSHKRLMPLDLSEVPRLNYSLGF